MEPAPAPALTRTPTLDRFVEAVYPPGAEAAKLEGRVLLSLDLSAAGDVTDAQVLEPAGHGFDEAALAAVKQFHFTPGEVDGKPAPVRLTYAYNFVLGRAPEAAQVAQAGPVNLSGRVLERGTRRPVLGAEVALPDLGRTASTDGEGRFGFRDVPAGRAVVVIAASDHQRVETHEEVTPGRETQVTYYVLKTFFSVYETVIRGAKERKEVSQTSLSLEEVQRIPGTTGDALKVVQNLPGVARAPFNGGLIVIRGTSPQESGIFLDGERLPLLFHFGGLTAVYNSDLLESVDYLPGNFSTYYGGITGGVVDVKSRNPKTDGIHGVAEVNLYNANGVLEARISDSLSIALAGRRSYIDLLLPLFLNSDAPSLTVAPRFDDAQLKLVWKPDRRNTVQLLGLHSQDALELVTKSTPEFDPTIGRNFRNQTGFNQLRLRHVFQDDRWRVDTIGLLGKTAIDFQIGVDRGLAVDIHPYGLRSSAEFRAADWLTAAAGVDWLYQTGKLNAAIQLPPREGETNIFGPLNATQFRRGATSASDLGVWAELRLQPFERLLIVPGVRVDQNVFKDQRAPLWSADPRLAVRYRLLPAFTLKGGLGIYHAPPSLQGGETDVVFGNPDLGSKRSIQSSLGFEWNLRPDLLFSAEGFYNRLSNLPTASSRPVERGGQTVPEVLRSQGIGRVWGAEVLVRQALTRRLFGWIAYTYSRSERLDRPGAQWRLFDFDQTHILTAIASYKIGAGWELGARYRYASGNPDTPVVGAVKDDNTDTWSPFYGPTNSQRLPAFSQLDIRVDKSFVFDTWALNLYLDVQNVFSTRSVEGTAYSYNYAQRAFFTGLPILPILGLKATF